MITAIALDDEPPALDIIKTFCDRIDTIELKQLFTKTMEAYDFLEENAVDLLFLDINMPSINGIDFLKKVPYPVMVVFTTSYSEYAVTSYDLNALDYLVKPFTFKRFQQTIDKAIDYQKTHQKPASTDQDYLVLRVDYALVKLPISQIEFIEGLDNYLKIHSKDKKTIVVRMTMKALMDKLPQRGFVRVHRSFIVPLQKVEYVRNKLIMLDCKEEIPLSSKYEEDFMRYFEK